MEIYQIILLISIIGNVLSYYLFRNWDYKFTQPLEKNNLINDENVDVVMKRKGDNLHVSITSKNESFVFKVDHNLKPATDGKGKKKNKKKG